MLNKILFVIALGFFVGLAPASADPTPAAPSRVKGRIIAARVQGHVDAISKTDGQKRVLHDGDPVAEKTEIVTAPGANIILVFSNGATVNVGADSNLDIEQFDQDPFATDQKVSEMKQEPGTSTTRLNLTKGELVGKVVHLNVDRGSEFTVETPVGAAGIRGTTFRIIYRKNSNGTVTFSVTTSEGKVVFTGPAGPVEIGAGQEIEVTFDVTAGMPSTPIVVFNMSATDAALIEALSQAIEAAVVNTLFPPTGNNGPNGGGNGNPNGNGDAGQLGAPDNAPSLPAIPAPATTPGAGGP
jgi:hypothetical protein